MVTGLPYLERVARIELANKPWQGFRLPLHHTRIIWCPKRDSNSHAEALASKTSVSTNSTIGAYRNTLRAMPSYYHIMLGVAQCVFIYLPLSVSTRRL